MKLINSFKVATDNLPSTGGFRTISINGDGGAELSIQVSSSGGTFYNFKNQAFEPSFVPSSVKHVVLSQSATSNIRINFPSSGSDITYFIIATGKDGVDQTFFLNDQKTTIRQIEQAGSTSTVTFQPASANSSKYTTATLDGTVKIQSIGSSSIAGSTEVTPDFTLTNTDNDDDHGFGLRLTGTASEKAWYFEATETVDGTTSSSTSVVVDDLTDLAVGMELVYKTGTTAAVANTSITAIDTATKTLTLSKANSLTDGNVMTFRAYGPPNISKAIGLYFSTTKTFKIVEDTFTTTIRGAVSDSTTVALADTYGIGGGNNVTYTGTNVNNSAANAITSITTADVGGGGTNGVVVVQLEQTFKGGEVITFIGTNKVILATTVLSISQYPTANRTIYLDLDKFITPGAAS